jgi:RHS repeat-associated protein
MAQSARIMALHEVDEAVDSSLAFATSGSANWSRTTSTYYYDGDSAQSGTITHNQATWMKLAVGGGGTLSFYWKVSSQASSDYLEFYIDGARQDRISGSTSWQQKSYTISGSGNHLVKWRYVKDYSGSSGSDCGWVDKVEWTGSAPQVTPAPPSTWTEVGYSYDPAGRRIEKKYDGTAVVKYLYDGDHCLAEYDGNNNLLRKYIYGPAVDEPISMIDVEHSNATYYYHFDGLGSVTALTNASGTTAVLYEYSVYGQVAASDPNHPNRFTFTGREFDKETGLYYYRARYYNPEIGRFLQTDPSGYGAGMNLYAYCMNGPMNRIDPFGLDYVLRSDPNFWKIYEELINEKRRLNDRITALEGLRATISGQIANVESGLKRVEDALSGLSILYSQWWLLLNIMEGGTHIHDAMAGNLDYTVVFKGVEISVELVVTGLAVLDEFYHDIAEEAVDYYQMRIDEGVKLQNRLMAMHGALYEQYWTIYNDIQAAKERLKEVEAHLTQMGIELLFGVKP